MKKKKSQFDIWNVIGIVLGIILLYMIAGILRT